MAPPSVLNVAPANGRAPAGAVCTSERPCNLLHLVGLDDVALAQVVPALDADAALEPLAHLAHVLLEAPQRAERAVVDHDVVAQHAHPCAAPDQADRKSVV